MDVHSPTINQPFAWYVTFTAVLIQVFFSCRTARVLDSDYQQPYTLTKRMVCKKGAVVSAHPLASKAGLAVLKQGGNAFDAAIAVQLALAVVVPGAGNLGGGGFMVARTASGEMIALDFRETAPQAATPDMYLNKEGGVNREKTRKGHLAVGVPGTVAGLFETMKYARLPFAQLIGPAIDLAKNGYVLTQRGYDTLNNHQKDFTTYNTAPTAFQRKDGWKAGDTLAQPELAATFERIRDGGRAEFYEGTTARLIVDEMKRGSGLITLEDLKAYKAKWRTPHSFTYKGYTVVSMPLPASGGLLLHQMLKMVEDQPLPTYGYNSARAVQLMTEVERRAFADRTTYMGDPDFYKAPAELTSAAYLKKRMADYRLDTAGTSQQVGPGILQAKESEETTHLCVIDGEGNAVSVTTTLNGMYGSQVVVGSAGFFLNNEMDDFTAKPGTPNMWGAISGAANAIAPGKRMLSSSTPTIVSQNGKPWLVVGTPGGTTIPTSIFQTLVNLIDFGLSTQEAINGPKFHHQWYPDQIDVEKEFPTDVREALRKMGYKVVERKISLGQMVAIKVLPDGRFEAVGDRRFIMDAQGW